MFINLRTKETKMEKKYCKDIEQLSKFAKALGHPARWQYCNAWQKTRGASSVISTNVFPYPRLLFHSTWLN
jgi:hypothetical protein